ncbi:MAG: hypothetical protein LBL83_08960, partial [Clostridiales bacterium]|nr:hypothetical protein [Clostridiales bacterium]
VLLFEGIDTVAEVFLNGERVGASDNMLVEHAFPARGLRAGANGLVVHILPAAVEARKRDLPAGCHALAYNYDSLALRKAPHMFGWDIMPRILSAGLWRSASLLAPPAERIEEIFLFTRSIDAKRKSAVLKAWFKVRAGAGDIGGYRLKISGACAGSEFSCEQRLWSAAGHMEIRAENCLFWQHRNAGEASLYQVRAELFRDGALLDEYSFRFGIRTVALERTSITDAAGSGEFCFYVNGEKTFVLGTNWVPLDAFHSRDGERLAPSLALLLDSGCNAVRCWGGNVYESDAFFDFCDEHGILVWQDFAMACAVYPQTPEFAGMLRAEAEKTVKRLRNHPSLLIWAGDNECDQAREWSGNGMDPNRNALTRELLPDVLAAHDWTRPYLPSSPYIDGAAFADGGERMSETHLWGPRDYFKGPYYAESIAHFASETGYHGCPSPLSVRQFISGGKQWPPGNDEWNVHAAGMTAAGGPYAYRIPLMAGQVRTLFGGDAGNLEDFARMSQISQAEAMKFFIERFRTVKWRRTGIIWWNLIDGWPQFSDAIVDYYFRKKLAYFCIRRSQQPLCLMCAEPARGLLPLVAVNDRPSDAAFRYVVTDCFRQGETVAEGCGEARANSAAPLAEIPVPAGGPAFLLIEWTEGAQGATGTAGAGGATGAGGAGGATGTKSATGAGGAAGAGGAESEKKGRNHYYCGAQPISLPRYLEALRLCGFDEWEGF